MTAGTPKARTRSNADVETAGRRVSWILRLSAALPGSPLVQGVAIAAGLLALALGCEEWTRRVLGLGPAGNHDRYLLVLFPALTGYSLGMVPWGMRQSIRDLAALRPHLRADAPDGAASEDHLARQPAWMVVGAIAAGLVVGLVGQEVIAGRVSLLLAGDATARDAFLLALAILFWVSALSGFAVMVANALFFARLGDRWLRMDLFARSALAPFARVGLRYAGMVAGLLALQFLLAVVGSESMWSPEIEPDALGTLALGAAFSLCVALVFSATALVLPSLGVHRAIRREKTRLLAALDERLLARGDVLDDALADETSPLAEAAALLTLRERIETAAEWPFDHLTRVRFTVVMMVPPASWVAAAAIENALFG